MTHSTDAITQPIVHQEDSVAHGAWLGPAIGAGILTVAWTLYLIPLLIGIFSAPL